ncbi:MAG TPA: hypothetical protein VIB79_15530 [Candidatus Binatia bacterium]
MSIVGFAMEELKTTKEFLDSVKSSGLSTLSAAKTMVFQPVKTLETGASGVGLMFRFSADT